MSERNGEDTETVICCFGQSNAITNQIDGRIKALREDVAKSKETLRQMVAELCGAFDAQLAAVELRRKALTLSMNPCPGRPNVPRDDWENFMDELPARVRNSLLNDKIMSFEDLLKLSDVELLRVPNFGRGSLAALKNELRHRNMHLS